jgi:hypothetical protein
MFTRHLPLLFVVAAVFAAVCLVGTARSAPPTGVAAAGIMERSAPDGTYLTSEPGALIVWRFGKEGVPATATRYRLVGSGGPESHLRVEEYPRVVK